MTNKDAIARITTLAKEISEIEFFFDVCGELKDEGVEEDVYYDPSNGVWAHVSYDETIYAIGVWDNELEALRALNEAGYGSVIFWPFGMDLGLAEEGFKEKKAVE